MEEEVAAVDRVEGEVEKEEVEEGEVVVLAVGLAVIVFVQGVVINCPIKEVCPALRRSAPIAVKG
ncbi:MAG: hypothetical protein ACQESD_01610 [Thermoplasmatota archaeon]